MVPLILGLSFLFCYRAYYRIATLFHHTMQLQFDEQQSPSHKAKMHKDYITKTIQIAKKNFALLVSMIVTFTCFWYPLFILTLSDPHFRADVSRVWIYTVYCNVPSRPCHRVTHLFVVDYIIRIPKFTTALLWFELTGIS